MEYSPLERGEHVGRLNGGDGEGEATEYHGGVMMTKAQTWEVLARANVVSCETAQRELGIGFIAKAETVWHMSMRRGAAAGSAVGGSVHVVALEQRPDDKSSH